MNEILRNRRTMKGTEMHSRKSKSAILLLILGSLLVTILLAACGDATATTGPGAQPPTVTVPVSTTAPATTAVTTTAPATTKPVTTAVATTAPATTKPVTTKAATTAPATTVANPTKPATTAATTAAPTKAPTTPPTTQNGSITLGQAFDLKMGQSMTLAGSNLTVRFAQITEDSRCPSANPSTGQSVECFWSGQVTADIEVSGNGQISQTIKLTLPGSVNTKTVSKDKVGNYQFEVKEILPKKFLDVDIAPGDYAVTLVITQ